MDNIEATTVKSEIDITSKLYGCAFGQANLNLILAKETVNSNSNFLFIQTGICFDLPHIIYERTHFIDLHQVSKIRKKSNGK